MKSACNSIYLDCFPIYVFIAQESLFCEVSTGKLWERIENDHVNDCHLSTAGWHSPSLGNNCGKYTERGAFLRRHEIFMPIFFFSEISVFIFLTPIQKQKLSRSRWNTQREKEHLFFDQEQEEFLTNVLFVLFWLVSHFTHHQWRFMTVWHSVPRFFCGIVSYGKVDCFKALHGCIETGMPPLHCSQLNESYH